MTQLVVCDTSSLTRLHKTDTLRLLPVVFDRVLIPPAVLSECRAYLGTAVEQIRYESFAPLRPLREAYGLGEREALALAADHVGSILLTDDKKARRAAIRENLGTITSYDFFATVQLLGLIDSTEFVARQLILSGEGVSAEAIADMLQQTGEPPLAL